MSDKRKISDLIPDHANANKGTERGRYALEASLRQYGAGRSILLDKNGRIIAGNKTVEVAADVGLDDVLIVQTDGKQIVAVQRTDLDIDSEAGRGLAYADNRVGELSLEWDAEQVIADLNAGVDLSALFFDFEIDRILGREGEDFDPNAEWQGMPEFEQNRCDSAIAMIIVRIASELDLANFSRLMQQNVTIETKSIWYPKKDKSAYGATLTSDEP
jgi:hypothetical protein